MIILRILGVKIPSTNVAAGAKGQLISKRFSGAGRFPPKNEQKQVDLRFHSSKIEFVRSFFGENVGLKKIIFTLSDL